MFKKNIKINVISSTIKNKKINFENDNIKPILAYSMINLDDNQIIKMIIDKSKVLFEKAFKDPKLKNLINPKFLKLNITEIDQEDFEKKLSVLFFYLYGLQELNNHIKTFKNRDIFLNYIIPNNTQFNNFLNINFNIIDYDKNQNALFVKYDAMKENYYTIYQPW